MNADIVSLASLMMQFGPAARIRIITPLKRKIGSPEPGYVLVVYGESELPWEKLADLIGRFLNDNPQYECVILEHH